MNREEFLKKLQEALSGEIPPEKVYENLQYYKGYIRDEKSKGRSEEEIMEELGDPRMIARTIIDTTPGGGSGFEEYQESFFGGYTDRETMYQEGQYGDSHDKGDSEQRGFHVYQLNTWYHKLLALVLVIGLMTVVIAVISGILSLLIPMLPMICVVAAIMWFVRRM